MSDGRCDCGHSWCDACCQQKIVDPLDAEDGIAFCHRCQNFIDKNGNNVDDTEECRMCGLLGHLTEIPISHEECQRILAQENEAVAVVNREREMATAIQEKQLRRLLKSSRIVTAAQMNQVLECVGDAEWLV